jgi:hypothetical protein
LYTYGAAVAPVGTAFFLKAMAEGVVEATCQTAGDESRVENFENLKVFNRYTYGRETA